MIPGLLVGAMLALGPRLAWGQGSPTIRPLRIALENYPPYEYVENGDVKGINVDIIKHILDRLGIPYEFKVYPFSRGWLMLKRGTADAAPSISYSKEREPFLFYTDAQRAFDKTGAMPDDYLWMTKYVFFANRKFAKSLNFESYDQIQKDGYKIGIVKEYSYHPGFLEEDFIVKPYFTVEDGLQGLARGEIDLFPMDETVASHILERIGLRDQVTALPKVIFSKPYLMVFSRKSDYPDLETVMTAFNAELRSMRASGEIDAIRHRHLPEEPGPVPLDRPLLFVCESWEPFAYMDGDTIKGIDVEITSRIMKTLGIAHEVRIYPWSRAWMMACNGKADAVLSISYKQSREDVLLYTDDQRRYAATGELPENYLWISEYVFFVKKKFAGTYTFDSYEQLREAGYRVGRNRDYSYDDAFLGAKLPGIEFNDTKSGLDALVNEQIDLYPMDKTVGTATLKAMGLQESVTFLPRVLFSKPYLAPFVKASDYPGIQSVMERFNRELHEMRESGELDKIREAYLGNMK